MKKQTRKEQQNYKWQQYQIRYNCDNVICQYVDCWEKATQIAHRIAQTKVNIKKYGWEVIHHNFNLVSVCCLAHNDSFNIAYKYERSRKLIELIKTRGEEYLQTIIINHYLEKEDE